jgi:hypothetical protein
VLEPARNSFLQLITGTVQGQERLRKAVFLIVWIASAIYAFTFADRGWVPHDEGSLAQMAERVLDGQMPHRDFDETYTGSLTYAHAFAFRLGGVHLLSPRLLLFLFFLAFVPALHALGSRLLPPLAAGALTFTSVVWSVPNYFASMPSWYVLFFSTFGILAILHGLDTERREWFFVAGLCGGLALLVKVVGLYFVAAVLLFFAFREQMGAEQPDRVSEPRSLSYALFQVSCCVMFLGALVLLIGRRLLLMEFVQFVAPTIAVTGILIWRARKGGRGTFSDRLHILIAPALPFLLGVLLPVILFVLAYGLSGAIGDLYRGVFVLPRSRIEAAWWPLPPLGSLLAAIPYLGVLLVYERIPRRAVKTLGAVVVVLLALALVFSARERVYKQIWYSARSLTVVAAIAGCFAVGRFFATADRQPGDAQAVSPEELSPKRVQEIFLLLATSAQLSLIQFPFSAPIYFCYVAPLVGLALAAVARKGPSIVHLPFLVFYLFFGVFRTNPSYIWDLGVRYRPYRPLAQLRLERGGLRVPERDRDEYETLTAVIERHGRGSRFLYATPDCPEVYFLSGKSNPTRVLFEFLRGPSRPEAILALLDERAISVIVINGRPEFSGRVRAEVRTALEKRYPFSQNVGRFEVRWREAGEVARASSARGSERP